jgi:hypothetical protein
MSRSADRVITCGFRVKIKKKENNTNGGGGYLS